MRGVSIADCEGMFIKDEYRTLKIGEDDLKAIIQDDFTLHNINDDKEEDEEDTPSKKRVTWREALEEKLEKDECLIVDVSTDTGKSIIQIQNLPLTNLQWAKKNYGFF